MSSDDEKMINHEHKFIFVHVPKTGGTSIESIFNWYSPGYSHFSLKQYKNKCKKCDSYFKFAFVRNPWDKFVSEHRWYTNKHHRWPPGRVKSFYKNTSFEEFLIKFFSSDMGDPTHRMSYLDLLSPVNEIDFIGRFENFQKDFNIVCDKIGIPKQELPHKYETNHKHYTEYYDDETRQIVAEKYAKDIEYFGYEFGE